MLKNTNLMIAGVVVLFVVGILDSPGYAEIDPETIVGIWLFDEGEGVNIHDISDNGNDGTFNGSAEWTEGKFGTALHFNGSSYIEIPFDESMKVLNEGDFTFTTWIKSDIGINNRHVILQQGDLNGTGRIWLWEAGGDNTHEIRTFLGGSETGSGGRVTPGEWYHVALTVTEGGAADTIQIYINGDLAGEPFQKGMESCEGNYFIGCHKNIVDFMDGIMDEFALFNAALTQDDIKDLMNKGIRVAVFGGDPVEPQFALSTTWGKLKLR